MFSRASLALGFALALVACKGTESAVPDAAPVADAAPFMLCGNGLLEGDEACDDSNESPDDGCSSTCTLECGDGAVTGVELCDPAIAAGTAGACPTEAECTDDDPCTTGVVSGTGCAVICEFATTTAPAEGDSCCPAGADATTDGDCTAECGNGVVETPESCDTTIAAGLSGACPTSCDDGQDCTTNTLSGEGTCAAACSYPDITVIGPADGCCPDGATPGTDGDCSKTCGDGEVTAPETCDTDIATGAGSCPTADSCADELACTSDALVNAGTCRAACTHTPVPAGAMDLCCPPGADLGDDPDCAPACGDGVITAPETCDDNNDDGGDGCSDTCRIEPVAFRMTDLDLKDPHVFAEVLGCQDVTNLVLGFIDGVNPLLQTNIRTDEDADGFLDLTIVNAFSPLIRTAGSTSTLDLVFPDCTPPYTDAVCELPAGAARTTATATNMGSSAVCLGTIAEHINTGYGPIATPTAPTGGTCYVANAGTVTFSIGVIEITLIDAHIAGVWFGANEIRNGLVRGFLTEETANATIIPAGTTGIDAIDGKPLSELLGGGTGACDTAPAADKDTYTPPGGTAIPGWYFYLNFSASRAAYSEL